MSVAGEGESLLDEIERMTEFEGMVDFCRDLRESMTFYDREVLLATFTGILEGMMITALFEAALEGVHAFETSVGRLDEILHGLSKRLMPPPGPLDVEALVHRFLDVGARGLRFNVPVYVASIQDYAAGREDLVTPIDARLLAAWRTAGADGPDARTLGPAGAAVLRGQKPSSAWLRLEGRGIERIHALWTLRDAITSLPGIGYPLGPASEMVRVVSLGRRPEPTGGAFTPVVDLAAARRRRRRDQGYDEPDEDALPPDENEEAFWYSIFDEDPLGPEIVEYARIHPETRYPLMAIPLDEGLQESAEESDQAIAHALQVLERIDQDSATEALVSLVSDLDPESALFALAVERLLSIEPRGLEEVAGIVARGDPRTATRLAPVLASSRRSRRDLRVFELLTDLLRRAGWAEGKERVAAALEEYGDARAVPLLESALEALEPRTLYQEAVVRRALSRLSRETRRPRLGRTDP